VKFSIAHKTFSVALSFFVLFSTLSLTIEKHFCGDTLIDVAIFSEAEKCSMEAFEVEQAVITKKPCCKDETSVIEGIQLLTNSFEKLDKKQKQILLSYSFSYLNLLEDTPKMVFPHKDYSPPLLIKDIQCLDETYLI